MGIHSGPVNQVRDVNDTINVAGGGINVAQRVMDCGDAGHILLSKHVADDLSEYRHWQPYLHDLGEYEVKHGLRLHIVNLYKEGGGNPDLPEKLRRGKRWQQKSTGVRPINPQRVPRWAVLTVVFLCVLGLAIISIIFVRTFIQRSASLNITDSVSEKSIAVLPFENLSDEKQNAYFSDGIQDEILTDLAKIADLKVISRTSVMQYKSDAKRNLREIARQLASRMWWKEVFSRAGNKVRVSAQLIDARTDMHIWADNYERELADVFAIQSEIAKKIADQLQAKISATEREAIESR